MEKEYKYLTERMIIMFLSKYQVLQQQELKYFIETQTTFDENNNCHIYFILKRPRISINPGYLNFTDEYFEIELKIQIKDKFETRLLKLKNNSQAKKVTIDSEYPYNYFSIKTENQNYYFKAGALLDSIQQTSPIKDELLDFEVLYIGQSFGTGGNKNATDRLNSHSTLQKIYNESIIKNPDSEIWLMLSSFSQKNVSSMDGTLKIKKEHEVEDVERFMNFTESTFSEQQNINFTEAALIRTFQPKFNKEYKNSFPNPAHESYSECYKLDLNGIVVELDLSSINRWLYSEHLPRGGNNNNFNYWQFGKFHFVTDDDRYKMFNNDYV